MLNYVYHFHLMYNLESTRSTRSSRSSQSHMSDDDRSEDQPSDAPPSQKRKFTDDGESSPLPLAPISPNTSQEQREEDHRLDTSLQSRTGLLNTSDIDPSSPLNYGTPASRLSSNIRGTP